MSTTEAKAEESATSSTEQAKEKVHEAALQVQEKAQEARGQFADRVRVEIDTRSSSAGTGLQSAAQAFRRSANQLREEGQAGQANAVDQVVDRVERLGNYLTQADGARMLDDVESFARRQPWVVVGGSLVVGLLSSRLLKASSSRRYEQQGGRSPNFHSSEGMMALGPASGSEIPAPSQPPPASGSSGRSKPQKRVTGASGGN